jgi:hypothetical protein
MAVKELPLVWRTCDEEILLSEGGAMATIISDADFSPTLVARSVELTVGKHYWEVEILNDNEGPVYIGVTRPNLDPDGDYTLNASTDGWLAATKTKDMVMKQVDMDPGDRVGVLLDLDEGLLRFSRTTCSAALATRQAVPRGHWFAQCN